MHTLNLMTYHHFKHLCKLRWSRHKFFFFFENFTGNTNVFKKDCGTAYVYEYLKIRQKRMWKINAWNQTKNKIYVNAQENQFPCSFHCISHWQNPIYGEYTDIIISTLVVQWLKLTLSNGFDGVSSYHLFIWRRK
jgi:hypothetical protein